MAMATHRTWSAIRLSRWAVSLFSPTTYFFLTNSAAARTIGIIRSMSCPAGTSCITAAIRSRPIPVSMFLFGSGASMPPSRRSNCVNTRFQISTYCRQSQAGPQVGRPHPPPRST